MSLAESLHPRSAETGQFQPRVTREDLAPLVEQRYTTAQMARRLGVDERSIQRYLLQFGFREKSVRVRRMMNAAELTRAETLDGEGMLRTWIAEDLGMSTDALAEQLGTKSNREWLQVWAQIRKNPTLVALHREFAPK